MRESDGIPDPHQPPFSVKIPSCKPTNAERRSREYLTPQEVDRVIAAARKVGRHAIRNTALMLLMYRHGLRVAEAVALRWEVVDMQAGTIHVCRVKQGRPAVHPLRGPELRALRQLRRTSPDTASLFVSERGGPLTARAVHHIILRAGEIAGLSMVTEALELVKQTGMRWYEAETYRIKGIVLLHQAVPNAVQAETCFHQALDIARRQEAKAWELRAAMSLAHLWQQ